MRKLFSAVLLCLSVTSAGCVALAIGGGYAGFEYATGSVTRTYPHSIDVLWTAGLAAFDELELKRSYQLKDQLKGHIERHTATGDRINLRFTNRGAFTDLTLRVNTFGDKEMSLAIIHKIEQLLPVEDSVAPVLMPPTLSEAAAPDNHDDGDQLRFPPNH